MKNPQVNQWPKKKSVASNRREVCAPSNAGTADADRRFQRSQTRSIASVALHALLMAAALGWWLSRRLTRPMTQPAHATHRLAAGQHDVRVHLDGEPVDLTLGEVRLLHTLHAAPGRVFSRQQLLNHLHDDGRAVTDRVVDSHVRNLRRKLATVTQGIDPICSVYGVGYSFEWPASD